MKSFRSHFPASAAQLCREWSPSRCLYSYLDSSMHQTYRGKTIWGRRFDHVRSLTGVCVTAPCLQQSPTRTSSPLPLSVRSPAPARVEIAASPLHSAFLRARQNIHPQFHEHKIDLYCCGMMAINQSLEPGHSRLNVPTSSGRGWGDSTAVSAASLHSPAVVRRTNTRGRAAL